MFYGWKISLLSMSGNFMLQGTVLYCMNAFMEPLCALNGWTRAELNVGMALATLAGQIAMPLAAGLCARHSLRRLMAAGALTGGLATILLGHAASLPLFTLLFTVAWVSTQVCGGVVGNALVSNWFHHYRGRAFGIANAGTSLSGVILPLVSMALINACSVATAYLVLGLLTCLLAPLSWFLVRDTPKDMRLHPDGRRHEPRLPKKRLAPDTSFHAMLHAPKAYCMGLAFGLALMVGSAVMSQMKPRFADLGLAPYPAMLLACAAALFAALGKYLWGWICDRLTPLAASRLVMLTCLASMGMGFLPHTILNLAVFSVVFGACIGGLWTVLPAAVSYYFGSENFLPSYKFVSIFIILRCAGYPIMGYAHDFTGGYAAADVVFMGALAAALLLSLFLREDDAAESLAHYRHAARKSGSADDA
ncbi:MFS transporter [Desulfovibrio legallii]|uniref:Sugar phosphate permease n=1 Tax=Desulfovibrio legallii TaxID=571438 RepID=A0A1G7IUS0_9BACT|nr:MFS transporter [Desulfovibrio legallii]SDF16338.1 Sugar phosphate permease [Desulfovibrio legallii]